MLYSRLVGNGRTYGSFAWRLLAGLEASARAAVILCTFVFVENLFLERSVWYTPRLFSQIVLGASWTGGEHLWRTIVGYAVLLFFAAVLGVLFAAIIPPTVGVVWAANFGIVFSLASYLAVVRLLLAHSSPGYVYTRTHPALLVGYFLFGVALGLYPRLYGELARPLGAPPGPALVPPPRALDEPEPPSTNRPEKEALLPADDPQPEPVEPEPPEPGSGPQDPPTDREAS